LQGEKIFIFSRTSKPDLSPKQRTIQWVPWFFLVDESAGAWSWPLISIQCWGYKWL